MIRTRLFSALLALVCFGCTIGSACAAEISGETEFCFSQEDFSPDAALTGICLMEVPTWGALTLGSRVLCAGDVLTAGQLSELRFTPANTAVQTDGQIGYLPIFSGAVGEESALTFSRKDQNTAPVAEDSALETYRNLPNTGRLKVTAPEDQALTYALVRQPKRGTVTLSEDGSFTYTPKKNKVGIDSFTYTATGPSGKTSREATVTITILKPSDAQQYTDTTGLDCRFAAEWMRHSGIFTGEQLAKAPCFGPDKEVTRGEFVTMLVKALEIPTDEDLVYTGYTDDVPKWLQPYLAAAVRSGLTAGLPEQETFGAGEVITGAEVAVLLQNALDLTAQTVAEAEVIPVWAQRPLAALHENGFALAFDARLTRADAAEILYQAAQQAGISAGEVL